MTDQPKSPIDARIQLINENIGIIGRNIEVSDKNEAEIGAAALTLLGVFLISLSEIAYSVGKIANQTELEFKSQVETAVDAAAEKRADEKIAERSKRKFFGKP